MRAWVVTVAGLGAADYACHKTGLPTFSSTMRHVLRTDTRAGRVVFMVGFCAFAYWFPQHILKD